MADQPDPAPTVLFDIGIAVESCRIHRSIGMDGNRLIKSLSGDADDDAQRQATDLHLQYFKDSSSLLRRLPGSRELLEQVRTLGLQVVLASSADEVDVAKPEPTIIEVALDRAGVDADNAVFVGDAVWDVVACGRAEVAAIGLLSGGVSRGELENAGAEAVFDNPRDLSDHIGSTRISALGGLSGN